MGLQPQWLPALGFSTPGPAQASLCPPQAQLQPLAAALGGAVLGVPHPGQARAPRGGPAAQRGPAAHPHSGPALPGLGPQVQPPAGMGNRVRTQPRGSGGYEEPSLWDPPCQGLAAPQPVPAPCRVTAAAPVHPGACCGRGHGARRGRARLWGMGCCGTGVSDPTSPSVPHHRPGGLTLLPCHGLHVLLRRPQAPHCAPQQPGGSRAGVVGSTAPASWPTVPHGQLGTVDALHPSLCPPSPMHSPGPWWSPSAVGFPRAGTHSSAGDSRLSGSGCGSTIVAMGGSGLAKRQGGYLCPWGGLPTPV